MWAMKIVTGCKKQETKDAGILRVEKLAGGRPNWVAPKKRLLYRKEPSRDGLGKKKKPAICGERGEWQQGKKISPGEGGRPGCSDSVPIGLERTTR